jgi:hypothetical protein
MGLGTRQSITCRCGVCFISASVTTNDNERRHPMTRKRLILLCVVSLLVCIAIGTGLLLRKQGPQITPEQCERLQPGMTEEEVTAILGRPCDHRDDQKSSIRIGNPNNTAGHGESSTFLWSGRQGSIEARFDNNGKLTEALFWYRISPSVWRRIRVYLGLEPGLYGTTDNEFPTSP